jgi:hypothetical protein
MCVSSLRRGMPAVFYAPLPTATSILLQAPIVCLRSDQFFYKLLDESNSPPNLSLQSNTCTLPKLWLPRTPPRGLRPTCLSLERTSKTMISGHLEPH